MRIAVDGYNVIAAVSGSLDYLDLEAERQSLVDLLASYRVARRHNIVVVFDGWQVAAGAAQRRTHEQGISLVFSPLGVKADTVLEQMARTYGSGLTVVTSDRELQLRVHCWHAVSLGAEEFYQQVVAVVLAGEMGCGDEGEPAPWCGSTRKKGNARRLSRKQRQKEIRRNSL
ncbi:MAG: NYN domain-containing protein [Deltaproteobacteria bacterium]|nr:NYN domain-containing protein [Candidatus Anaeroferrophillus wilburensis]MBN2889319.1 NYN domain-containing protein [Deltaproteobacteria bacterium]